MVIWTNNGTFSAGSGTVEFVGSNNATISGSATTFNNFILKKGTNVNTAVSVSSDITISNLTLTNGLLSITGGATVISGINTIPQTAGIEINGVSQLTTGDFSIDNRGLIRIVSGNVNFGNSSGNSVHTLVNGAFIVEGGTVNIAGRLHNSAGGTLATGIPSGINISGGTINLATVGNSLSGAGALNVTQQGAFSFTAGTINIINANSTIGTAVDLAIAEVDGNGTKNITNGVFHFGNGTNNFYNLISAIDIPNITTSANTELVITRIIDADGTYIFSLSDGLGNEIPVEINITADSYAISGASIKVTTTDGIFTPNKSDDHYLSRYWTVELTGVNNPNYSITADYPVVDIIGTESEIKAGAWNGSLPWTKGNLAAGNILSFNGLTEGVTITGITADAPTVTAGALQSTVCTGDDIKLTSSPVGDAPFTFTWIGPNGFTSSEQNPTRTSATTADAGAYSVTVTDGNGFKATSADLDITVNTPPSISVCPATPETANTIAGTCAVNVGYTVSASGTPVPTYTYLFSGATSGSGNGTGSGSSFNVGTTMVTVTATNSCGTEDCTFDVVVTDNEDPVPVIASLPDVTGQCSATIPAAPTANDNCSGLLTATTSDSLTRSTQGTSTVTWTFDDGNGNTFIQTQDIVVTDTIDPVPVIASLPDVTGQCSATIPAAPTANDNCSGLLTATTSNSLTRSTQGTSTVTWTFDDGNGNTFIQTQDIVVTDTIDPVPVIASLPDVTGQCLATIPAAPTANDNCSGLLTATTSDSLTRSTQGTSTVTWTFDDGNGNTFIQTQDIVVTDTIDPVPVIASLPDVTGQCSATIPAAPTANDNCSGLLTATTSDSLTRSTQGTSTVTWTFDDGNGNTFIQTQDIVVTDTIDPVPVIASLPDVTGQCSATIPAAPTANDNCSGLLTATTSDSLTRSTQGTSTVTWTFDDGNGNTFIQTQDIVVTDTIDPVPVIASLPDVTGQCSATIPAAPTANDNCSGLLTATTSDSLTRSTQGTSTVTWTFDDGNGNTFIQTQYIVVTDTIDPVPVIASLPDVTGQCSATIPAAPTANDNCSGLLTATTSDSLTRSTQGTSTVTWTFDDGNGNTFIQTQDIVVTDTTPPTASNPAAINVQCLGDVPAVDIAVVTDEADNCGTATVSFVSQTANPLVNDGTITRTYQVSDGNGQSITVTQDIIINDTTPPTLTAISNRNENVGIGCNFTIPDYRALTTAADNCTVVGNIVKTQSPAVGSVTSGHNTTQLITITANDGNGNTVATTFTITLKDVSAPVKPILLDVNLGECSGTPTAPTTTDNCAGTITGTPNISFPITTQGTTVVTWTFADGNGNSTTANQNVIVDDITPPVTPVLADIDNSSNPSCSFTVTPPTTTDNCAGLITGTTTENTTFNIPGNYEINWFFDDGNGQSVVVTQNVTFIGTPPEPDLSTLGDLTINGCQISSVSDLTIPIATDVCGNTIPGTLESDFIFPFVFSGTQPIDWYFIDSVGNETIYTQNITLVPLPVAGGAITAFYNSETFTDNIDITSCGEDINIAFTLAGASGTKRWERWEVNHAVWEEITDTDGNDDTFTVTFINGAMVSTYYRVIVNNGSCYASSNQFGVRALPPGEAPDVFVDNNNVCLSAEITLTAVSNYTISEEAIPGTGGYFNQGTLKNGWTSDGLFTAGGSSKKVRNWSGSTNNGQENGSIVYNSNSYKFAIAYGNYYAVDKKGDSVYDDANPTTLFSPIYDLTDVESPSINFDQAYYFADGDYAAIQISTDGGLTFTDLLVMHNPGDGIVNWYDSVTAAQRGISTPTEYEFENDNTSIELDAYLDGKPRDNVQIKWLFSGTTDDSTWALDNLLLYQEVVVETEIEWTDGIGDPNEDPLAEDGSTTVDFVFTPDAPGRHEYGGTSLINGCRSYDAEGTGLVEVFVSYAYAGGDKLYTGSECGQNTVQLNAYDNTKTAIENASKGAFTLPNDCINCEDDGTMKGEVWTNGRKKGGLWTISEVSGCGGGSISDPTNPDAIFTGEAGVYTLTWMVGTLVDDGTNITVEDVLCSDNMTVVITSCDQVDFDGTDDYVDFNKQNYNLNQTFSLEVWVKPESISGKKTIFSKRDANAAGNGYDLTVNNGIVSFNWNGSGSIISPYIIGTNRWYHIAITRGSDSKYKLYVDGIFIDETSGSVPAINNNNALLGAMDQNNNPPNKPVNYFNGWIDEFRIWDVALTEEQIHQMMNQKIITSPTISGNVQGEIIPIDVNGLLWSNLMGYYQMENLLCGYLNPTAGSITGKLKNITTPEDQTAPIPYISANDGDWNTMSTWVQPLVWNAPNSNGITGAPIDWNIVETSHNITSNRDITLLGLVSKSGELTMNGTINANGDGGTGEMLWITHYLKLDGSIDLAGESQLLQKRYSPTQFNESILAATSVGFIERDQQGQGNLYNYEDRTSPVSSIGTATNNNGGYTIKGVLRNGINNPTIPEEITFIAGRDGSIASNPIQISERWLYTMRSSLNFNYSRINSLTSLTAGQGFTIKGSLTTAEAASMKYQNFVYVGKPNNGDIAMNISKDSYSLVGNPYPSALDANQFINDNLDAIWGAIYLYQDWGTDQTHIEKFASAGFATYSLAGFVEPTAPAENINNPGEFGSKTPQRYIPVSQGFWILGDETDGGVVKFNNNQRIFKTENDAESIMFKTSGSKYAKATVEDKDLRTKIRIGFSGKSIDNRQILLTIDGKTTDGIDKGYDAKLFRTMPNDLYWVNNNHKLVIQAVSDLPIDRVVPLGITINEMGAYKIKVDAIENPYENMEVYLRDNLTMKTYDIKNGEFEINLENGEYSDKYSIVFQSNEEVSLEIEEVLRSSLNVFVNENSTLIFIQNPDKLNIKKVSLFNIIGQQLNLWESSYLDEIEMALPINVSSGVYFMYIDTEKGNIMKKILIK